MDFCAKLAAMAVKYNIKFSDKQLENLTCYYEILKARDYIQNADTAIRIIIDCLACYDPTVFPVGCRIVDVGTGTGFPGLLLKILRPDVEICLLDWSNKRLPLLREVVDRLGLSGVTVVHAWAEDAGQCREHREQYQVALSRGIPSSLTVLLELCLPLVCPGGYYIAFKSENYQEQVAAAAARTVMLGGELVKTKSVQLTNQDNSQAFIYIKKVRSTPTEYPRSCLCNYVETVEEQQALVRRLRNLAECLPDRSSKYTY